MLSILCPDSRGRSAPLPTSMRTDSACCFALLLALHMAHAQSLQHTSPVVVVSQTRPDGSGGSGPGGSRRLLGLDSDFAKAIDMADQAWKHAEDGTSYYERHGEVQKGRSTSLPSVAPTRSTGTMLRWRVGLGKELARNRLISHKFQSQKNRCILSYKYKPPARVLMGYSGTHELLNSLQRTLDEASVSKGGVGMSLGVAFDDGRVIQLVSGLAKLPTAGLSGIDSPREVAAEDRFGFGSTTKLYTAVAVLRLVEAGVFKLDELALPLMDEAFKRFSGESLLDLLGWDEQTALKGGSYLTNVTVRMLLDMSSGIKDLTANMDWYFLVKDISDETRHLELTRIELTRSECMAVASRGASR